MKSLPAESLRTNFATWGVTTARLAAVGSVMHDLAPNEVYDPRFVGQDLCTYYFDTPGRELLKARTKKKQYLTLRLRHYAPPDGLPEVYALSAKTESGKWRIPIDSNDAAAIRQNLYPEWTQQFLPANLLARLQGLVAEPEALRVCVNVRCRRYSVEDAILRYTLDVGLSTDLGKQMPFHVLEFKSTEPEPAVPATLQRLNLRSIKLSKFKWAMSL